MRILSTFILVLIASSAFAQADTLIYAEGKIINAVTKEAVVARISYQSLPYGNKVGFLSGSSYSFPLFDKEKYSLTIEAAGYAPAKYMLDPAEANSDRKVIKDIELTLPQAAANNAETTHTVGKVLRLNDLMFDAGNAKIASSSFDELNQVAVMLKNNPKMVIQLEGHTDVRGDARANLRLSEDRVDAVKSYLVSRGATGKKIKTKAFGGTQPISHGDNEEAHAMNRRVELRILQN